HLPFHRFRPRAPAPTDVFLPANVALPTRVAIARTEPMQDSLVRQRSYFVLRGVPKTPLLRRTNLFPSPLPRSSSQAVKVPWRPPWCSSLFPPRFEPVQLL